MDEYTKIIGKIKATLRNIFKNSFSTFEHNLKKNQHIFGDNMNFDFLTKIIWGKQNIGALKL